MLVVVTVVSFLVQVYSRSYMIEHGHRDPGYSRFFAYLSLFTFSMLAVVLANNLLFLFIGWELVGLCSYLLIGFWYDRTATPRRAPAAAVGGRQEGVPHHPRRRRRLPDRPDHPVEHAAAPCSCRSCSTRSTPKTGPLFSAEPARPAGAVLGVPVPVRGRGRQERPVPAARVAARRHGRPDARFGADPRRDHGRRGRVPGRAHLPAVRGSAAGADRRRRDRRLHGHLRRDAWAWPATTSSASWRTRPSASSAT